MQRPVKKHDALPLSIQLSVLEDCYVTMLDIAMLDVTSTPLARHRERERERVTAMVLQAVSFDQWKRCDPLGILFYNVERGNRDGSTISDQNWIKNREAAASRFTLPGLTVTSKWTSEWMNLSLVFCSLPLCHFLILSFQVVCFWEKILQHDFACCLSMLPLKFQGTWMVPSSYPFLPKQTSEKNSDRIPIFCTSSWNVCISLPINAKKNLLQHLFFAKHTYLVELHLELNSGSSLHLYRSLSLFYTGCAPFRAWKCSQARPAPLWYCGSPLSAVSSTCKEITRDKCYGSVRLALFTASLTKKCVVWNCALSKWQCLHNETSVTRSIWIQARATPTSEVW